MLGGALAPTLAPPGSEWGMDDLDYLQGMYDAGAAPYFDVLAVHAYGWAFPPDDPPDPAAVNFAALELLREIMVRNGDEAKQVMITEGGWNDHPRWTKAVRPSQRVAYTVRAYEMAADDGPGLRCSPSGRSATRARPAPTRTTTPSWTASSGRSRSTWPCSGTRSAGHGMSMLPARLIAASGAGAGFRSKAKTLGRAAPARAPGRCSWPGGCYSFALAVIGLRVAHESRDTSFTDIRDRGAWRVGMDPSFPPFENLDPVTGQPAGFDVDLARAIAARWGVRVELVGVGFDELIDATAAGRIDSALSALPAVPWRDEEVVSSIPYVEAGLLLAAPAGSSIRGASAARRPAGGGGVGQRG